MTEQNTAPKPRKQKSDGPKDYLVSYEGKSWLLTLDSVKVASNADLRLAVKGTLPQAKLEAAS